jgi:hypothetical protein
VLDSCTHFVHYVPNALFVHLVGCEEAVRGGYLEYVLLDFLDLDSLLRCWIRTIEVPPIHQPQGSCYALEFIIALKFPQDVLNR